MVKHQMVWLQHTFTWLHYCLGSIYCRWTFLHLPLSLRLLFETDAKTSCRILNLRLQSNRLLGSLSLSLDISIGQCLYNGLSLAVSSYLCSNNGAYWLCVQKHCLYYSMKKITTMRKINGETVTGVALVFLETLFIMAGTVNPVWALLFWADVLIIVIGVAFIVLGMWTLKKDLQSQRTR